MIALGCALGVVGPAAEPMIIVRETSHVSKDVLTLMDLAEVVAVGDDTRKTLEGIELGKAPHPGLKRAFDKKAITDKLVAAGVPLDKFKLSIPGRILVTRDGQPLSREQVLKSVESFLAQALKDKGALKIKSIRFPETFLPMGHIELRVSRGNDSHRMLERFYVNLDIYVDERREKSCLVEVRAEMRTRIAVANRAIKRGESITENDFRMEERNAATLLEDTLSDPGLLIGKVAKTDIAPGPVLTRALDSPKLVSKDDIVTLWAEGDRFKISTKAKAKKAGKQGDFIQVLNLDTGKTLLAEVIGKGEVRVKF